MDIDNGQERVRFQATPEDRSVPMPKKRTRNLSLVGGSKAASNTKPQTRPVSDRALLLWNRIVGPSQQVVAVQQQLLATAQEITAEHMREWDGLDGHWRLNASNPSKPQWEYHPLRSEK